MDYDLFAYSLGDMALQIQVVSKLGPGLDSNTQFNTVIGCL